MITLSDGSSLEVSQTLVTININQMPLQIGNKSYNILDNSLIHDESNHRSHFDEHLLSSYKDQQLFINDIPDTDIDFDRDGFQIDGQETPADILFPSVPSLTHYSFYSALAVMGILCLIICCYCCVPTFRNGTNKLCLCLVNCLPNPCQCRHCQIRRTEQDRRTEQTQNSDPENDEKDAAYYERLGRRAYKRIMKVRTPVQSYSETQVRDQDMEMAPLQSQSVLS